MDNLHPSDRPPPDPFEGLSDEAVLARAKRAFEKAVVLPPGSIQRSLQWSAFDSAMAELDRRLTDLVLKYLEEKDK
jgi:hypothetical protein